MKDLNVSWITIKVLEENIGRKILDIPLSNIFSDISLRARNIMKRINKWDLIKIKSFCSAKENIMKMKTEPMKWENIFVNDTLGKDFNSIYKKNSYSSTPGRQII